MSDYYVESEAITNLDVLKKNWLALQGHADCSFFQSWGWIGNWLEQIAKPLSPRLICVYWHQRVVGLGIFVPTVLRRHLVLYSHSMFLNEAPFDGNNMVIEYNGLLAARNHEAAVYQYTLGFLLQHYPTMDEYFFSALTTTKDYVESAADQYSAKVKIICQEISNAWSLTLDYPGNEVNDYLATLGKNRRLQIKRSLRLYAQEGGVQIEAAQTPDQALTFMDGLKLLHTQRWQQSGKGGSFANPHWDKFHRAIIKHCFPDGEIQLLRVFNAQADIGYLYNFLWRGRVYVLQTGFAQEQDKRLMSGYVCHVLAIDYYKNKGMAIYDLMHGDSLYKKLLCNQSQPLYWLVVQRKEWRFLVEDVARVVVRRLRKSDEGI